MIDHHLEADIRLDRIIEHTSGIKNGSLRTHLDEWAAFRIGGGLLTERSKQRWFNNPCPWKDGRRLLEHMDWFSLEAAHIMRRGVARDPAVRKPKNGEPAPFRCIVEHAVPVRVIGKILAEHPGLRQKSTLLEFLLHHYQRAVLTKREDQLLRQRFGFGASLSSRMPDGWKPWGDPFARYRAVGIA